MPLITVQEMIDAKVDVDHIEDVTNGTDVQSFTPRLGGPAVKSIAMAIKALEDNGFTGEAMFEDTTFGIAGTNSGQLFTIPGTTPEDALKIYGNMAGVAVDTGKRIADAADLDTRITQNASDIANISLIDTVLGETSPVSAQTKVVDISSFSYTNPPTAWLQVQSDNMIHIVSGSVTNTQLTVNFGYVGSANTVLFDVFLISND